MSIWHSLKFGARALALKMAARKPRQEIERIQRRRLRRLLQHAREHSSFYREKLAGINLSSARLPDLPTTNKAQMSENLDSVFTADDLHRDEIEQFFSDDANLGKLYRGKYVVCHTSGSQGRPLVIVQTMDDLELLFALQASRGNWQSLGVWQILQRMASPVRLAAVTLQRGFYPSAIAFEYMPEGPRKFIDTLRLSLGDDDLVERLQEYRPTHLTAYASVLHELARQAELGRLNLRPELEQVVNISERLIPKARRHYEQVFDVPILDDYAMGECLFLSNGCVKSGGMHVNADWAVLEVVDEENRPVPDGQMGAKVLMTNLSNFAQPFIRYEIGDRVTMSTGRCGCGSNLPLIERVDGRDSDMLYVETPQGRQPLHPAIFDFALAAVPGIREYQIVQENNDHVRVRVESLPDARFDSDQANHAIQEQLDEVGFDHPLHIEFELVDRLTPEKGAKFKRFVSQSPKEEPQAQ
jgi:phenylacetate-coenzyme A ligase PaaK-like adenylate-forming protein